jgi:hypothetical protein
MSASGGGGTSCCLCGGGRSSRCCCTWVPAGGDDVRGCAVHVICEGVCGAAGGNHPCCGKWAQQQEQNTTAGAGQGVASLSGRCVLAFNAIFTYKWHKHDDEEGLLLTGMAHLLCTAGEGGGHSCHGHPAETARRRSVYMNGIHSSLCTYTYPDWVLMHAWGHPATRRESAPVEEHGDRPPSSSDVCVAVYGKQLRAASSFMCVPCPSKVCRQDTSAPFLRIQSDTVTSGLYNSPTSIARYVILVLTCPVL